VRERRLAETRRAIQEDMLGLVVAAFCRGEEDAEVLFDPALADVLLPTLRAECLIKRARAFFDDVLIVVGHNARPACRV